MSLIGKRSSRISPLRIAVAMALAIGASVVGVAGPASALTGSLRGAEGYAFGTFEKQGTSFCNADGSGEIHYTASNPLSGPLGGSMMATAVITLGAAGQDGRSPILDLSGTFTITGGAQAIDGTLSLAPARQYTPGGSADFMNQAYCAYYYDSYFQVTARFSASDVGGVFEEGFVKLTGSNSSNYSTAEFWVAPTISIQSDYVVDEAGISGSSNRPPEDLGGQPLTIRVFPAPIDPIEVHLLTADDTAIAGQDYTMVDETVLIPAIPGNAYDGRQTIVVDLNDDIIAEGPEQYGATIELVSGHAFNGTVSTIAQIADNDATTVSLPDVSIPEGNAGSYPSISLTMSAPAPVDSPVYACLAFASGGTAIPDDGTSNTDYYKSHYGCQTTTGDEGASVVLYPGQAQYTAEVGFLLGDDVFESDETIELAVDWIWGATLVGDGTVTVTILNDDAAPNADADGDGVIDAIGGGSPGSFNDGSGTIGQIIAVPVGLTVAVSDALLPGDGVRVVVGGTGTEKVTLSVCGGFTLKLSAGSDVVITCGSVTIKVAQGSVEVELASGLAAVTIPAGAEVKIDTASSGGFSVNVLSVDQANPVIITVDGVARSIGATGITTVRAWDFVGFDRPVDGGGAVNSVKAGRAVPLKWRLLDATGAPVLDLASAGVTFIRTSCSGGSVETVEATSTVGSGLQNLGDGWYQLNWKTPKVTGCGTMQLDVGDGVLHTAKFQLT